MTRLSHWSTSSCCLALVMSALSGCGCLSTRDERALQSAHRNYRIGNYRDALDEYRELTSKTAGRDCREVDLALTRQASCLLRLEGSEEALRALSSVDADALSPEDRRELRFVQAETSIERGRVEELRHLPDLAPGADAAARSYGEALRLYEEILRETPLDFEALRGRGEALLRFGIASVDGEALEVSRDVLRRCVELRDDDLRARFFLGLAVLHGPDGGSLTSRSGDLLLEALRLDRDGNHDVHAGYVDLFLHLRAFATPPDVRRAVAARPDVVPVVEALIGLLEDYVATGRVRDDAAGVGEMRTYVTTYRLWEAERDEASRTLARAKRRLKAPEVGAVDRGRSAMELVLSVPPPFDGTPEYAECRSTVQSEYATILMESSRTLIDLGARERPRSYLDTVRDLLRGPWVPQPSPLRKEADDLAARIDALEGLDRIAALSTELLNQNRPEEARMEFARYRESLEGSAELALVAGRIEEHERELEDPEELASIRDAIRRGDLEAVPDDSLFAAAVFRETARAAYRARDYAACLGALASLERLTPSDALLKARCYHETGRHEAACELLSRSPLEDNSFFEPADYAMAAVSFLEAARGSRRSSDRMARYRRARELFESAGAPIESIHDELVESYRSEYLALRSSSVQDRAEIEAALESLLRLEPGDAMARRELAFVLYAKGGSAKSSIDKETVYRRAYGLLRELEEEGELDLPLHQRKIYRRLIACYGDFVPLAAGNRWVYAVRNGLQRVVVVKGSTAAGHFEVEIDTGLLHRTETWSKDRGLLARFDAASRGPSARWFPIRLPDPDRGTSWSYAAGDAPIDAEIIASGVTRETPAGRFTRCITVRVTNHATGVESYHDFAPGVGEIRMESEDVGYELTEFEVRTSAGQDLAARDRR